MIYLDLDGVLVDFVGGACEKLGIPNPYLTSPDVGWDFVDQETVNTFDGDFWRNLKPTVECEGILHIVRSVGSFEILTSPTDHPECVDAKTEWVRRFVGDVKVICEKEKWLYAKKGVTLIDDNDRHVESFNKMGAYGILIPRHWNALKHLAHVNIPLRLAAELKGIG